MSSFSQKPLTFNASNFHGLCDALTHQDEDLKQIINRYGYPPMWSRKPTFKTLIHFILEQQVSLASAKAALVMLQNFIGRITPENLLRLTDEELRACYFSRQKIIYARCLANAIITKEISLLKLKLAPDDKVRAALKQVKGIGDWTADVFLMMALNRCDCFPAGDVALVKSIRQVKNLPANSTKEEVLITANQWQPNRTIAAYLLWHAYLKRKQKKL